MRFELFEFFLLLVVVLCAFATGNPLKLHRNTFGLSNQLMMIAEPGNMMLAEMEAQRDTWVQLCSKGGVDCLYLDSNLEEGSTSAREFRLLKLSVGCPSHWVKTFVPKLHNNDDPGQSLQYEEQPQANGYTERCFESDFVEFPSDTVARVAEIWRLLHGSQPPTTLSPMSDSAGQETSETFRFINPTAHIEARLEAYRASLFNLGPHKEDTMASVRIKSIALNLATGKFVGTTLGNDEPPQSNAQSNNQEAPPNEMLCGDYMLFYNSDMQCIQQSCRRIVRNQSLKIVEVASPSQRVSTWDGKMDYLACSQLESNLLSHVSNVWRLYVDAKQSRRGYSKQK